MKATTQYFVILFFINRLRYSSLFQNCMPYIWASKSLVPTGHILNAVDADTDRHNFGGSGSDLFYVKIILFLQVCT